MVPQVFTSRIGKSDQNGAKVAQWLDAPHGTERSVSSSHSKESGKGTPENTDTINSFPGSIGTIFVTGDSAAMKEGSTQSLLVGEGENLPKSTQIKAVTAMKGTDSSKLQYSSNIREGATDITSSAEDSPDFKEVRVSAPEKTDIGEGTPDVKEIRMSAPDNTDIGEGTAGRKGIKVSAPDNTVMIESTPDSMELSTPDNTDLWKGNADKASAPHNTERQKQQKADQRKGKKGGRRRRVKKKKSESGKKTKPKRILYWNDFYGSRNFGFCCGSRPYHVAGCKNTNCQVQI